jgi:hypothetical protein
MVTHTAETESNHTLTTAGASDIISDRDSIRPLAQQQPEQEEVQAQHLHPQSDALFLERREIARDLLFGTKTGKMTLCALLLSTLLCVTYGYDLAYQVTCSSAPHNCGVGMLERGNLVFPFYSSPSFVFVAVVVVVVAVSHCKEEFTQ